MSFSSESSESSDGFRTAIRRDPNRPGVDAPTDSAGASTSPGTGFADPRLGRRDLGILGESLACDLLVDRGWRVIERNWRSRHGELDIIALDDDGYLVFVEVKTRRSTRFGTPAEAVTPRKQRHLRLASCEWLAEGRLGRTHHHGIRFDVVSITVSGGLPRATLLRGAF